ncbi:MAG: ribosome small subunit-dependent GTPase A [Saprospiraceae bacterium]|nr:ribosome small subunit-dependent GTPase A [Saprospiraceae bacterium]
MILEDLGYNADLENFRNENISDSFEIGRVISEHKERYVVKTTVNEFDAEIIGNLRFSAQKRSDFPAVGDWVAISEYDENKVLIHSVFPRKTIIERQAVGKQGEKQIIATNIDYAFIVQAVDRDFNINRIERYLTICNTSKVKAIIILNKIDLISDTELSELIYQVQARIKQVPIIAISNESKKGIEELKEMMLKGKTYCLLGSSGVGKSSLLNNLAGKELMKTDSISSSTNKGQHVTSHRELIVLENGGILIDNPGMREVGITDSAGGLEITFKTIAELSKECKFKDCTHTTEIGCAVIAAVDDGEIDENSYENYLKMEREKEHFESTIAERRKKDKDFGKMVKHFKNSKANKY